MSVLIVTRYVYYVVEVATVEVDPQSQEPVIYQKQLIPCYISELIFSALILFHIYEANELSETDEFGLQEVKNVQNNEMPEYLFMQEDDQTLIGLLNKTGGSSLRFSLVGDPRKSIVLQKNSQGNLTTNSKYFPVDSLQNRYKMTVQNQPGEGDVALLLEDQGPTRQTLLLVLENPYNGGEQHISDVSSANLLEEDGGVQE